MCSHAETPILNDIVLPTTHLLTGVCSYAKLVGKCMLAVSPNGSASNMGSYGSIPCTGKPPPPTWPPFVVDGCGIVGSPAMLTELVVSGRRKFGMNASASASSMSSSRSAGASYSRAVLQDQSRTNKAPHAGKEIRERDSLPSWS